MGFSKKWLGLGLAQFFLFAVLLWYRGLHRPLSDLEVEHFMATIQGQSQVPGGLHDLPALRHFFERDDGQPVYTLNLYQFRATAEYADGRPSQVSGAEAYDRFAQVMIPLLAKHASHPIFGSSWSDPSVGQWDRAVLVRYRSRRDMARVFASDAYAEACAHKWASLAKNERMVIQALHLPDLRVPVLTVLLTELLVFSLFWLSKTKAFEPKKDFID